MRPIQSIGERRSADYSLLKITKAFKPVAYKWAGGTCGNLQDRIFPTWTEDRKLTKIPGFYERVSAPMLLGRLCALFMGLKIEAAGQRDYKVTWTTVLKHKETGKILTFYDWKGSASFGSDAYGEDAPESFIRDVRTLLDVLANPKCPHPYDGCVVGEIA